VFIESHFNLCRCYLLTLVLDNLLQPVDNKELAIFENGNVSRSEPAIAEGIASGFLVFEITSRDNGPTNKKLTWLTLCDILISVC